MNLKTLSICTLMLTSMTVLAQDGFLNSAAQALETGQKAERTIKNAPADSEALVKETAAKKLKQATPVELQQGIDTAKKLKTDVNAAPKLADTAVKSAESSGKQKVAEKALDLLR
jgi:hypothetical protein